MTTEISERDRTLRIVRFFLPRLGRQEMANEIEGEKIRLQRESSAALDTLKATEEEARKAALREKEDYDERASRRVSDARRDGEDRIRQETDRLRSRLEELEHKKSRDVIIMMAACLVIVCGIVLAASLASGYPVLMAVVGTVGLIWISVDCWKVARACESCRSEIQATETAIREQTQKEVAEEESKRASALAEYDSRIRSIHEKLDRDLAAEEESLRERLGALDAQLEELVRLYEDSIATEEEVVEFSRCRLAELQYLVAPALGLHPEDVLDERSAEIWAPSFLQAQAFPEPVLRDATQSEREILEWADDVIEPMRTALPKDDQWTAFRARVLPMLGLRPPSSGTEDGEGSRGDEPTHLSALRAVRFSAARQTYLSGHYFYQKIVCAEDMIGIFRAYVNLVNRRVPHTFALQILYSDIAAIGIETAFNRERYDLSAMTIDQHTHTLSLELSSGTCYRMSGDAGSAGQIEPSGDAEVEKVVSEANQAFQDQIVNVRGLIRDAKAPSIPSADREVGAGNVGGGEGMDGVDAACRD